MDSAVEHVETSRHRETTSKLVACEVRHNNFGCRSMQNEVHRRQWLAASLATGFELANLLLHNELQVSRLAAGLKSPGCLN